MNRWTLPPPSFPFPFFPALREAEARQEGKRERTVLRLRRKRKRGRKRLNKLHHPAKKEKGRKRGKENQERRVGLNKL